MCGGTVNVERCFSDLFWGRGGGKVNSCFLPLLFLSCYNHLLHFPIFVTSRMYFFVFILSSVSFSHYAIGFSSTSLINPQLFLFLSQFQSDGFLINFASFSVLFSSLFTLLFLCFHPFISQCKSVFR